MSKFTHLHVHTEYSILDGLAKIPDLIEKAYNDGMRAMAMTDHGNMFGIFTFVGAVEKFNAEKANPDDPFKAIVGCEVYVAAHSRTSKEKKEDRSGRHLILLAKNLAGYHNLAQLVSHAYSEGFYYTPRIDKELLHRYHEGIIACSACLGGELPQAILQHNELAKDGEFQTWNFAAADKIIEEYKSIFGDDYYLEMQRNGYPEQKLVNTALKELAQIHNVKLIATNDVHFTNKEDFEAHRMLICINTKRDFTSSEAAKQDEDTDNGFAYTGQEYFRTTAEMSELFADIPEAITNTQEIVDKIEPFRLKTKTAMPQFEVPSEFADEYAFLEYLTYEGAKRRWSELTETITQRLEFELSTIKKMGFPGYFLIVYDLINEGKKMGVRFGPGRGSAAGSAIAYCLGITDVDPIKYDLLFERFLNPDRISLPDIDIDMEDTNREKVLQYVIRKYGSEKVAQIVTFNTMAAKSAIKDCARALQLPLNESNRLSNLVPTGPKVTLKSAFNDVPELKNELNSSNPLISQTLAFAQKLEGSIRSSGVHACGVIIGRNDLFDSVPLCTAKDSDTLVTQYEGTLVEDAGLLKMDFLGLKTLNIISRTLQNIKKRHDIDIDIDKIPIDDAETFALFSRADTTAIFQFESDGMRKYLAELKPERFEDIIAMVSLYRPGPMDNIPSFIKRKFGREPITYLIPEMGKYLDDTYGITVYQEQVMLLSQLLAGFTPGQADTLRKAMGKKKIDMMNKLKADFIKGGTERQHDEKHLNAIWDEWERFASYAFNKSHATCYALVSYQTAYLKAHYPAEFMAANMTNNLNNMTEITSLIEDTKRMGINVLAPDINESDLTFTVNKKGDIRFGLGALKGVGASAMESLIAERDRNGDYKNIFDFIERVNLKDCNRKAIEALAQTGAFDGFTDIHRAQFFHIDKTGKTFIEKLINWGVKQKSNSMSNQTSIFDELGAGDENASPEIPQCEPWNLVEKLRQEKEIAGFYISGYPLDDYKPVIEQFANITCNELNDPAGNATSSKSSELSTAVAYKFAAIVSEYQMGITKNNKEYGKITLEDYSGSFQWTLFGENFSKFKHYFERVGSQLFVKVTLAERLYYGKNSNNEMVIDVKPLEICYLDEVYDKLCSAVTIVLQNKDLSPNIAYLIKEAAEQSAGTKRLKIQVVDEKQNFSTLLESASLRINPEMFIKNLKLHVPHKIELH